VTNLGHSPISRVQSIELLDHTASFSDFQQPSSTAAACALMNNTVQCVFDELSPHEEVVFSFAANKEDDR